MYIWTTKEHQKINVNEMKDSHIKDTIILLSAKQDYWNTNKAYAKIQGFEIGPYIIQDKTIPEWLEIFYRELDQRNKQHLQDLIKQIKSYSKP